MFIYIIYQITYLIRKRILASCFVNISWEQTFVLITASTPRPNSSDRLYMYLNDWKSELFCEAAWKLHLLTLHPHDLWNTACVPTYGTPYYTALVMKMTTSQKRTHIASLILHTPWNVFWNCHIHHHVHAIKLYIIHKPEPSYMFRR